MTSTATNANSDHAKHNKYDVIVIGAGHNGLTTAAYLARAGLSTLLIEARSSVGGTAASDVFGGCTVNVCNCDHLTVRSTPIFHELRLAEFGLQYTNLDPAQINGSWTDDKWWPSFHSAEQTLDALGVLLPTERDNYKRYLKDALPVAHLILDAANDPPTRRGLLYKVASHKGRGATRLLAWSRMSASQVLDSYFTSPAITGPAITEGPMVWGVSPKTPGTGLGALTLALRHAVQVGRPVGGSGALPNALLASFTSFGGEVLLSTRVTAIVCHGDESRSIELANGDVIDTRTVVSACNPHDTFLKWLRNPPSGAQQMINRWRNTPHAEGYESKIDAIFTGDLQYRALASKDHQSLGLRSLPATVIVAPTPSDIHLGFQLQEEGRVLERPAFLANVPSLGDNTLAPSPYNILSLETLFTPYGLIGGWANSEEPKRWLTLFDSLLEEPVTPRITEWRAVTPVEYERDFHLPGGHATSFSGGPLASFTSRTPELTHYRTAVKNVYLTGAATFPGAGVWGASGRNAALTILRDLKIS